MIRGSRSQLGQLTNSQLWLVEIC